MNELDPSPRPVPSPQPDPSPVRPFFCYLRWSSFLATRPRTIWQIRGEAEYDVLLIRNCFKRHCPYDDAVGERICCFMLLMIADDVAVRISLLDAVVHLQRPSNSKSRFIFWHNWNDVCISLQAWWSPSLINVSIILKSSFIFLLHASCARSNIWIVFLYIISIW